MLVVVGGHTPAPHNCSVSLLEPILLPATMHIATVGGLVLPLLVDREGWTFLDRG